MSAMEVAQEMNQCDCGHACKAHNHDTDVCDCTDCGCDHCAGRQAVAEEAEAPAMEAAL